MKFIKSLALMGLVVGGLASAATFEGTHVSQVVERVGKDLKGEASRSFSLTSEIFRVTVRREIVPELVWDCEDSEPADGTKGDWKGFFEAKKEDKPYRLADAVKGIGVETARRLIDDGYFSNKPRSWKEFKHRMTEADAEYQTGFSNEVIVKFGKENAVNLGYIVEGQCGYKTILVERLVPVRTFVRNETRQYQVRILNAPLLTGEVEKLTVSFDGVEDSINANSYYNDYKVDRWNQSGTVVFDLTGVRKQVRPENTLNLTASVTAGNLAVNVADAAFDAEVAAQEERFVVGQVLLDKRSWKSNVNLGSFEKPLSKTSSVTTIADLGIQVPADANLLINYQIRVGASRYHNGEASTSKKLKLKLK
jgi:hypothetical protein